MSHWRIAVDPSPGPGAGGGPCPLERADPEPGAPCRHVVSMTLQPSGGPEFCPEEAVGRWRIIHACAGGKVTEWFHRCASHAPQTETFG